jgi:NADPH:quinone reductase
MRAMVAEQFAGYDSLRLAERAKPVPGEGEVLVRMVAAGVTPLDYTILSGHFPRAQAPLVLGNEGSGIVESTDASNFPAGTKVMFFGPYGVLRDGTYSEWLTVRREHLRRVPSGVDVTAAAGLPVAYLTAQLALTKAGFAPGKSVLAPGIGGSVGNAVVQLARARGAAHAISTSSSSEKARRALEAGFTEVIDLSRESLRDGVRRLTDGKGVDVVIDGIGGDVLSQALGCLALSGTAITLGYAGGQKSTIDVTDLIWKRAGLLSFSLMALPADEWQGAWDVMEPLLAGGKLVPMVAKTFKLEEAAEALRFLIEKRPFGRVLLDMTT